MGIKELLKKYDNNSPWHISCLIGGLCIEEKVNLVQFAHKIGMKPEAIYRLNNMEHYPTVRTLERIAKKLKRKLVIKMEKL